MEILLADLTSSLEQERRQAFSLNRDGLDADLDNLAISDSSSSDDEQGESTSAGNAEQFNNAEEQEQSNRTELDAFDASIKNAVATSTTKSRKSRGGMPKRIKKKVSKVDHRIDHCVI